MQQHMQRFVTDIVNMMKHEGLYYPQGGPIITSQVSKKTKLLIFGMHIISLHKLYADWEWIPNGWACIWLKWATLCQLGSCNGCRPSNRCSLDDVQAKWCSRSSCQYSFSYYSSTTVAESSNQSNNFMVRSIRATGSFVEKHLLDRTQLTSLHYGQKIGPHGICATIFTCQFYIF